MCIATKRAEPGGAGLAGGFAPPSPVFAPEAEHTLCCGTLQSSAAVLQDMETTKLEKVRDYHLMRIAESVYLVSYTRSI